MNEECYAAARELKSTIVMHTEFERVLTAAEGHMDMAVNAGVPISLIVTAPSGMGKTALLDLIARRVQSEYSFRSNESPLVRLKFTALVDTHKLAAEFLAALGFPNTPGKASLETITKLIDVALKRVRPSVGLIDEAQHVCEGYRDTTAKAVTDWLKLRMDEHGLVFLLAGTHTLQRIQEINPQFASRAPTELVINPFLYGPAWHRLLEGLKTQVHAVDMAILCERRVAKLVFDGALGNLRRLKLWLGCATYLTLSQQRKVMTLADLQQGFDRTFGTSPKTTNPIRSMQ